MSQINEVKFTLNGVPYKFSMTFHADNYCDAGMMEEFRRWGCCEPELLHVMQRTIKPGQFVIDGGANVGYFTILMSQMVGPKGKVLAIEPGENNLWKLEENLKINKVKNVEVIRRPLWCRHEKVKFNLFVDSGLNSIGNRGMGSKVYDAVMLSDFPKADFIKLDIEGAEEAALMGAGAEFRCPYVVAEMNEQAMLLLSSDQSGLRGVAGKLGYEMFVIHKHGALPSHVPGNSKIVPSVMNTNVLFSTLESVGKAWPEVPA